MAADPPQVAPPPQVAHARQVELLKKHVAYFSSVGDTSRAEQYAAELKNTSDRLAHAEKAASVIDGFGLTDEVTKNTITYNDAVNFVAKTLHEVAQGVTTSLYARTHRFVAGANEGAHAVAEKMKATRSPAAEVVEHLNLTDPTQIAAVTALFGKGA